MLIVYDDLCGGHLRGIPHPESPDRVEVAAAFLRENGLLNEPLSARDASDEEIERVHSPGYVALVRDEIARMRGHAGYLSTGDTVVDERSLDAARRAAGGAIVAAQTAMDRGTAAFAIVRPPGHHAESTRGMGFCVFNNAAIAARAVQAETGARALIVDFDYHHGNGTQAVSGAGLSYVSTHAYPAYPGTGSADENYALDGGDAIVNIPLPPHRFGTEAFVAVWQQLLPEITRRIGPDMLIVSAGFDYAAGDPVGDLGVDISAASDLAALIRDTAGDYCNGRVAYVLEGGYDTTTLSRSIAQIIAAHDCDRPQTAASASSIPDAQARILTRSRTVLWY